MCECFVEETFEGSGGPLYRRLAPLRTSLILGASFLAIPLDRNVGDDR